MCEWPFFPKGGKGLKKLDEKSGWEKKSTKYNKYSAATNAARY